MNMVQVGEEDTQQAGKGRHIKDVSISDFMMDFVGCKLLVTYAREAELAS